MTVELVGLPEIVVVGEWGNWGITKMKSNALIKAIIITFSEIALFGIATTIFGNEQPF